VRCPASRQHSSPPSSTEAEHAGAAISERITFRGVLFVNTSPFLSSDAIENAIRFPSPGDSHNMNEPRSDLAQSDTVTPFVCCPPSERDIATKKQPAVIADVASRRAVPFRMLFT